MAEVTKKHSTFISYFMIFIGTGIMGISIQNFYDPIGLVTGGFTGLAIVIKAATAGIIKGGIPLWFTNIVLNIPNVNSGEYDLVINKLMYNLYNIARARKFGYSNFTL